MYFYLLDIADDESANWSPVEVNKLIELWHQNIATINISPNDPVMVKISNGVGKSAQQVTAKVCCCVQVVSSQGWGALVKRLWLCLWELSAPHNMGLIMECRNSHKHSQSPLPRGVHANVNLYNLFCFSGKYNQSNVCCLRRPWAAFDEESRVRSFLYKHH